MRLYINLALDVYNLPLENSMVPQRGPSAGIIYLIIIIIIIIITIIIIMV